MGVEGDTNTIIVNYTREEFKFKFKNFILTRLIFTVWVKNPKILFYVFAMWVPFDGSKSSIPGIKAHVAQLEVRSKGQPQSTQSTASYSRFLVWVGQFATREHSLLRPIKGLIYCNRLCSTSETLSHPVLTS